MKPILATASVVRAFLNSQVGVWPAQPIDPSKPWQWQDRRPIKPQPIPSSDGFKGDTLSPVPKSLFIELCSSRKVGDIIYLRETFFLRAAGEAIVYRADLSPVDAAGICALYGGWKSSLHMPKKWSRIHLEVMRVRVERACNISEEDARAEGCIPSLTCGGEIVTHRGGAQDAKRMFSNLWQSIYGPDARDSFVWVYDLKRIR